MFSHILRLSIAFLLILFAQQSHALIVTSDNDEIFCNGIGTTEQRSVLLGNPRREVKFFIITRCKMIRNNDLSFSNKPQMKFSVSIININSFPILIAYTSPDEGKSEHMVGRVIHPNRSLTFADMRNERVSFSGEMTVHITPDTTVTLATKFTPLRIPMYTLPQTLNALRQ
jgi:hypothetical protein